MNTAPYKGTIRRSTTRNPIPLTARQVAKAYGFPLDHATGKGVTVGFVELGGGYDPDDIAAYFDATGLPLPSYTAVAVGSGSNQPTGDPDGPDAEVQSDMIVAGSVAPSTNFRLFFGSNSMEDFYDALSQAILECDVVSVSWGSPETQWPQAVAEAFETVIAKASMAGKPVFTAAGDRGEDDGTGHPVTDFPSSAPSAIGCGGTRLLLNPDGTRLTETVWDDNPYSSASGGGISKLFPGRKVPDVGGNADPDTGYTLAVDGVDTVIGGTSLVAPLLAAGFALLRQLFPGVKIDLLSLIAAHPDICFDVTVGSFRVGPGRSETVGFGVPDLRTVLQVLEEKPGSTTAAL
jgi:kumamolisin